MDFLLEEQPASCASSSSARLTVRLPRSLLCFQSAQETVIQRSTVVHRSRGSSRRDPPCKFLTRSALLVGPVSFGTAPVVLPSARIGLDVLLPVRLVGSGSRKQGQRSSSHEPVPVDRKSFLSLRIISASVRPPHAGSLHGVPQATCAPGRGGDSQPHH